MVNNLKRENDKTYDFYKAFIVFYYIFSHLQQALHVCQNKKKYRNLWPFLKGELNCCMIFEEKK